MSAVQRDGIVVTNNIVDMVHIDKLNTTLTVESEALANMPTEAPQYGALPP